MAPSFSADFKPLNYFLATNLLLPGAHLFVQDPPVPSTPTDNKGVAMPRDTILTGQIAKRIEVPTPKTANGSNKALKPMSYFAPLKPKQHTTVKSSTTPIARKLFPAKYGHVEEWRDPIDDPRNWNKPPILAEPPKKTLAQRFKEDLLADGGKPIFGELFRALADKEKFQTAPFEVLEKYGYGDLTGEDYTSILGFDIDALLPKAETNGTLKSVSFSAGTKSPFDIRVYGAIYSVESPSSDKGNQLLVNPQDGSLTYNNIQVDYVIDTLPDGQTFVSWSQGSTKYSIQFFTVLDNNAFVPNFKGTRTQGTSSAEEFKGSQYVPRDGWAHYHGDGANSIAVIGMFKLLCISNSVSLR